MLVGLSIVCTNNYISVRFKHKQLFECNAYENLHQQLPALVIYTTPLVTVTEKNDDRPAAFIKYFEIMWTR